MTYPFVGPVEVPTPTTGTHPTTKTYVDDGLATKSGTSHNHNGTYILASDDGAANGVAQLDASSKVPIAQLPTGSTSSTVAIGNDARLSDARTPTAHASSHASGGGDPVTPAAIGASATGHTHGAADVTSGTFAIGRIPTGTSSSTVAIGNDTRLSVKPYAPVTLTDGASVSLNASLGTHFRLTAAGNRTISAPSNPTDGQVIVIEHLASGGARTLALTTGSAGSFKFGTDITALTATSSGLVDLIQAVYNTTADRWWVIAYVKGF